MSQCKIKEDGEPVDVADWPDKMSSYLQQVFTAPEDEVNNVGAWLAKATKDCIEQGHMFSQEQVAEGALFHDMFAAQFAFEKTCTLTHQSLFCYAFAMGPHLLTGKNCRMTSVLGTKSEGD